MGSAHADSEAEAFTHWNEDDPAVVPESCAKCHSQAGYLDYLGADGTEAGTVDNPAPTGSTVTCVTCHNEATLHKESVVMPSGIEVTGLGDEARCMECHQGRESTISVNASIEEAGLTEDPDAVSEDLGFHNIHYYAAAATKYGTLAKGGYEYDGMAYDGNFVHVEGYNTCNECHNSHTLELPIEECATCHEDVESTEDLHDIRMEGSTVDYDGDGDIEEGIYYELEGLREMANTAIQAYADEVAGTPIVYNADSHPYFFIDANSDGAFDDGDTERYNAWTPRLLKAAYNYQVATKDPGAFAHGGKYIIELLHDSITDLNDAIAEPVDLSTAHRIDAGHFAGSEEAFRHWDEDGAVPGSCAKCHSAGGLPMFLEEGTVISQEPSNGFLCTTCHNDLEEHTVYEVEEVTFPSGLTVSAEDPANNLCLNCHQGRESTMSVNALIGDTGADEQAENLRFLNVHYFAAGATRYGTEAKGAYEYDGMEYAGFYEHSNVNSCTDCHNEHNLEVEWESCIECHEEVETAEDMQNIRYYFEDYDGDGEDEEGVAFEIADMKDDLYAAMQAYALDEVGTGILYNDHAYPYFFIDANGDGEAGEDETESFNAWTPRLLRAAYNYQYVSKDPGGYTHNAPYLMQVLYDSIEDVGGDVGDMMRP
ncbi:MAG: hypothetical protein H6642_13175 [Caldilineaceae bacterium]|nr:hypothetical protein [Caldilineaceae bacterium]